MAPKKGGSLLLTSSYKLNLQAVFITVVLEELEVRDGNASSSSFIVQDCFGYPQFPVFPYEVDYRSLKFCEELCRDFMGIALNL